MNNISSDAEVRQLMAHSGLPESVIEMMAFLVYRYGSELMNLLVKSKGSPIATYNDMYALLRDIDEELVVEIANPYAKNEYSFFSRDIFRVLLNQLLEGIPVNRINCLPLGSVDRYDFLDSNQYWE